MTTEQCVSGNKLLDSLHKVRAEKSNVQRKLNALKGLADSQPDEFFTIGSHITYSIPFTIKILDQVLTYLNIESERIEKEIESI
jgi:hypothetical protein